MTIYSEKWPSLGYLELNCPKGEFKRQSWQLLCHSYIEGDALGVLLLILFHSWQHCGLISIVCCNQKRNQPLKGFGWNVTLPGAFWLETVERNQEVMRSPYPSCLLISSSLQHLLVSLCTLEVMKIKSFNYPSGNAPVMGVEGKFLCVIVLGKFVKWICFLNQDFSETK